MPYLVEAGSLFAQGADPQTVDAAMLDFGMPMGPLRLLDEVGIDIALHVAAHLAGAFARQMTVPPLLDTMVKAGLLGRKSSGGFYTYAGRGEAVPNDAARRLTDGTAMAEAHVDEMQRRMVLLMVNEAARCIEENVADHPDDVDFAMIMGTGFAPFRGGPLAFADATGISNIVDEMLRHAETDPRFAPCSLLTSMATSGKKFFIG
jgi:3-hydroxyacyl-CoA dehydrogenase/enoyl-CoA hydratase/3-hydroxybutyryl-CoA epimerase